VGGKFEEQFTIVLEEVKAAKGFVPVKADTTSILLDNNVFVEQEKSQ